MGKEVIWVEYITVYIIWLIYWFIDIDIQIYEYIVVYNDIYNGIFMMVLFNDVVFFFRNNTDFHPQTKYYCM